MVAIFFSIKQQKKALSEHIDVMLQLSEYFYVKIPTTINLKFYRNINC